MKKWAQDMHNRRRARVSKHKSALLKINDENEEPKVVKPKTAPQKSSVENKTPKITRQKAGGAVTLKQLEKPARRSARIASK